MQLLNLRSQIIFIEGDKAQYNPYINLIFDFRIDSRLAVKLLSTNKAVCPSG